MQIMPKIIRTFKFDQEKSMETNEKINLWFKM